MIRNLSCYLVPLFEVIENVLNNSIKSNKNKPLTNESKSIAKIYPFIESSSYTNEDNYIINIYENFYSDIDIEHMDNTTIYLLNKIKTCLVNNDNNVNFRNFYYKSIDDFFARCPV
jgi:hypothetical protein